MSAAPSIGDATSAFTLLTSTDPAAIAVIRVAGPEFESFANAHLTFATDGAVGRLAPGSVRRAGLRDSDGELIDDLVVSVRSAGPAWDVWLHLHGGPWLLRRCCELLRNAGFVESPPRADSIFATEVPIDAAVAETLPAMLTLSGVRWLMHQAEIMPRFVWRLAAAAERHPHLVRRACARLAKSIEIGEWYSRPVRIALIGPPNAGKSTLFNRLVGEQASITSSRAGTTRDWVEAPGELGGFPVSWIDTAGIFEATDALDVAGVAAAQSARLAADLRVAILDATGTLVKLRKMGASAVVNEADLIVLNKVDATTMAITNNIITKCDRDIPICRVSAIDGQGISDFRLALLARLRRRDRRLRLPAVFTPRQAESALAASHEQAHNLLSTNVLRIIS